ncbi:hypothetical protein KS527_004484 [Salmonella enterica]|nr:hypothetical protein [Salmonella enterica]
MSVFEFMGNSPVLTFCLALLGVSVLRAAMRWTIIMLRGYPPMWCDVEGRYPADKDKQ